MENSMGCLPRCYDGAAVWQRGSLRWKRDK